MGGSSSKEKKSKPQTTTKRGSKKTKAKAKSTKVKAKKDSMQWTRADGEGGEVTFVPGDKRSSDTDADDLKPPPPRGRSKSLRFGDFAQMDRVHKVDDSDLLPIDIAFFQDGKVEPEELCHVCSVYTGVETLVCGVCYRVYHQSCLAKIGQWSGPPPDLLTNAADMWSCHQCANLGNLLTEKEIIDVLKRLDKCGIRREDDITLADYLAYCHLSLQEDEEKVLTREKADNARRRFGQVDSIGKGRITWCQFLNIESVRFLKKRNKNALVRLLTKAELERARDAFRILDTDKDGRITKATAHEALDRNSRRSGYYPDETMMYIDEDLDQSISWIEFLQDRAIYIIAERPCIRAFPLAQSTTRRGSSRSSVGGPTSLPVTPITKTPPILHGKIVAKNMGSQVSAISMPTTPVSKQQSNVPVTVFRHSDGAAQTFKSFSNMAMNGGYGNEHGNAPHPATTHKSVPTTPVKKQSSMELPLLPPPPPSTRPSSSHHKHRGVASVPSTPVKNSAPEFQHQTSHPGFASSNAGHAYHDRSAHCDSPYPGEGSAGLRLSGGSDSGVGGGPRRHSGNSEQAGVPGSPFRVECTAKVRRSSHGDPATGNAPTNNHVTGKPPMGNYGRAVAAPPYGKLVERVQKGEYRQTQARSMFITPDSSHSQVTPTFGHVTGDSNTGRRPLSLV